MIEDFNTDGEGSRYFVLGGGGSGDDFFGLQSIGNSFGFTGQEGADFFGGRDMNGPFSGGNNPVYVEIPLSGAISLVGPGPQLLNIMLAANSGGMWDAGQDYMRIVAINSDTLAETILDTFLPDLNGDLASQTIGGLVLNETFQTAEYTLPGSITNLAIRVEAYSTAGQEYLGFDAIQVVPEPSTGFQMGLGLMLLAGWRRRRGARVR